MTETSWENVSDEMALEMFEMMLLARKIDERMWLLNRSGKYHSSFPVRDRKQHRSERPLVWIERSIIPLRTIGIWVLY